MPNRKESSAGQMNDRQTDEDRYREAMGREPPPPVADDEPLAWQWDYHGTKVERERLRGELLVDAVEDRGPQPDQEAALF